MKKSSIIVFLYIFAASMFCASLGAAQSSNSKKDTQSPNTDSQASAPASEFKDEKEKLSYALGMRMALELKILRRTIDVDPDVVAQGLKDAMSGGKTRMTDEERVTLLSHLQQDLEMKEQAIKQQKAEENIKEGEAFLAANKAKEGVVTLASGLQYKVLTQGAGPKPTLNDSVVCNYKGTFIDGQEFDSSFKRGQPSTFPVAGVIRGWTEALQLMPVGSKWQLFVPASLAYGDRGRGNIEPDKTLIFEVELVAIKGQENPPK